MAPVGGIPSRNQPPPRWRYTNAHLCCYMTLPQHSGAWSTSSALRCVVGLHRPCPEASPLAPTCCLPLAPPCCLLHPLSRPTGLTATLNCKCARSDDCRLLYLDSLSRPVSLASQKPLWADQLPRVGYLLRHGAAYKPTSADTFSLSFAPMRCNLIATRLGLPLLKVSRKTEEISAARATRAVRPTLVSYRLWETQP